MIKLVGFKWGRENLYIWDMHGNLGDFFIKLCSFNFCGPVIIYTQCTVGPSSLLSFLVWESWGDLGPWSQDGAACMSVRVFSHPNSKYCSWEAVVFTGELYHCRFFRAAKSRNCTSLEDEPVLWWLKRYTFPMLHVGVGIVFPGDCRQSVNKRCWQFPWGAA